MEDFSDILLVTDLDGTFFGEKSSIVPRNMEAINYFKAGGGLFTIATGRMHCNISRSLPMVKELLNAPMISCNGALMYDMRTGKAMNERLIPVKLGMDIVDYSVSHYGDVGARVSTSNGFLCSDEIAAACPRIAKDLKTCDPLMLNMAPFERWNEFSWYKIIIRGDSDRLDSLRAELEKNFGDAVEISKSGASFLEIQSEGTNKSVQLDALREYCEKEKGRKITVWYSGDYENDLEIMKVADVAVCPANALDCVKEICRLCLCRNTEGLMADIIETIAARKGGKCSF